MPINNKPEKNQPHRERPWVPPEFFRIPLITVKLNKPETRGRKSCISGVEGRKRRAIPEKKKEAEIVLNINDLNMERPEKSMMPKLPNLWGISCIRKAGTSE